MIGFPLVVWAVVFQKRNPIPSDPPIIHAWTIDSITGVSADPDYKIACDAIDRLKMAYFPAGIPKPDLMAYFTDDEDSREYLGTYLTGTMDDYRALANQCRVRQSELRVRAVGLSKHRLDLETTYLLIFGEEEGKKALYRRRHPKKDAEIPTDPTTVASEKNGSTFDEDDAAAPYNPRDYYRSEDDE
jgi:hypothetical protein